MRNFTIISVFLATLALTFAVSLYARFVDKGADGEDDLAGRRLNRWLIGLSAATTGNSGFIVTGAVGLGYVGGATSLLLPLGYLVGDLIYWALFPKGSTGWQGPRARRPCPNS